MPIEIQSGAAKPEPATPWAAQLRRLGRDSPRVASTPEWLCLEWPELRQTVRINCPVVQGLSRLVVTLRLAARPQPCA
jgi:hypothetical protein